LDDAQKRHWPVIQRCFEWFDDTDSVGKEIVWIGESMGLDVE
jgi:hypothetical protein